LLKSVNIALGKSLAKFKEDEIKQANKSKEKPSLTLNFQLGKTNIIDFEDIDSQEEIDGSDEEYKVEVPIESFIEQIVTDNDAASITDSNQSEPEPEVEEDDSDSDSIVGANEMDTSVQVVITNDAKVDSKLDQLAMIDNVKADRTFVQPV
jgi:hypothetical protein